MHYINCKKERQKFRGFKDRIHFNLNRIFLYHNWDFKILSGTFPQFSRSSQPTKDTYTLFHPQM